MLENMLLLNWWVATGILILEIGLLGKLFSLIVLSLPEKNSFRISFKRLIDDISKNILEKYKINVKSEKFLIFWIFVFSFLSTVVSLVYSEVFLQEPCSLCWWQRIFIYGVTILSALPLLTSPYKGEEQNQLVQKFQLRNILFFSVGGLLFGLYQHVMQMLAVYGTKLPCPATSVDCSKMTLFEYGHITYPWLAVVLCAFVIVIILLQRKINK